MFGLFARFFMRPKACAQVVKPLPKKKEIAALPPAVVEHYRQTNRKTPNFSAGRVIKPTHVILHHTAGSYNGSVSWCCDPASKVSYHCIVSRSGQRTVLAVPNQRTWHAGVSSWQGRKDANSWSIGLAWEGDTHSDPLGAAAIASAVEYLLPILEDYHIPLSNIIRHADVAPGRKDDCSLQAQAALIAALNRVL
jgi:N-acetyl-anhydromuramyl-L-alanine amidase AmpD